MTLQILHHLPRFFSSDLSYDSSRNSALLSCSNAVPSASGQCSRLCTIPRLMDRIRTFPKCHRRHTIILRHNDIALMAETNQLVVHCIRAGTNHDHLTIIRIQDMIRVAKQRRPDMIFFCDFLHDTHDRAGIGIYKYLHDLFPLTMQPLPQMASAIISRA